MSTDGGSSSGLRPDAESIAPALGRWIRPATPQGRSTAGSPRSPGDVAHLGGQILEDAKRRVASLAVLERELEDRIRARWTEVEAEAARRLARCEGEVAAVRRRLDADSKDRTLKLEKEGRASGFREGFARGREDGYRLGVEEGRRDGKKEAEESVTRRLEGELAGGARALAEAASHLREESAKLIREAREGLLELSLEIARKVVKREVACTNDVVVRNVEKAMELVFRRGSVVLQVHPGDAPAIERALEAEPRWAEGFEAVEIRSSPDVEAGGCRLISGAGACDMTLETQLSLIEDALRRALREPGAAAEEPEAARSGWEEP